MNALPEQVAGDFNDPKRQHDQVYRKLRSSRALCSYDRSSLCSCLVHAMLNLLRGIANILLNYLFLRQGLRSSLGCHGSDLDVRDSIQAAQKAL